MTVDNQIALAIMIAFAIGSMAGFIIGYKYTKDRDDLFHSVMVYKHVIFKISTPSKALSHYLSIRIARSYDGWMERFDG